MKAAPAAGYTKRAKRSTLADATPAGQGASTFTAIPAGEYAVLGGDPDGPGEIEVLYTGAARSEGDLVSVSVKPGSETAMSIFSFPPTVAGLEPGAPPYLHIDVRPVACLPGTDIETIVGILERQSGNTSCRGLPEPAMDVLVTHLDSGREWSMRVDNATDWDARLYLHWLPGGEYRLAPVSTGADVYVFHYYVYPGQVGVALGSDGLAYVTLSETDATRQAALIIIFCVPITR